MRSFILGLAIVATLGGHAMQASATEAINRQKGQQLAGVLKESGRLEGYRIGVKYQDGVAWLAGSVTSREQKRIAERLIQNDAGVEKVVSKLAIAPEAAGPPVIRDNQFRTAGNFGRQLGPKPVTRKSAPKQRQTQNPRGMARPMGTPRPQQQSVQPTGYARMGGGMAPQPMGHIPPAVGQSVSYDNPQMPGYAWPSYAASPNYAALTYPKQYSPAAWPYIGPFYPYPQVPLGWRKVALEWDDGWWFLDFQDSKGHR